MARPLRLDHAGALWHITSRGSERREIFRGDGDRRGFLDLLGKTVERFNWRTHGYALMGNHYHLVVETPEPTLSRGMHHLNGGYAQRFNRRHSRKGHLFESRFGSVLVQRESHLLEVVRYVVLNPVRAGLVRLPENYEWSNFRATARMDAAPSWLEVEWTLEQFDPNEERGAIAAYRRFVLAGIEAELDVGDELSRSSVLGDEPFRRAAQERIGRESRSSEHPRREVRVCRPSVQEVLEAAAAAFDVATSRIARPGRHPARRAVALVAREDGLRSLREIGEELNVSSPAVSQLIKRARHSRSRNPLFEERLSRMRQRAKTSD